MVCFVFFCFVFKALLKKQYNIGKSIFFFFLRKFCFAQLSSAYFFSVLIRLSVAVGKGVVIWRSKVEWKL